MRETLFKGPFAGLIGVTTVDIKLMDIVGRRSYNCDILFRVIDIRKINDQKIAILYGEDFRLVADAPYEDLVVIDHNQRVKLKKEYRTLEEQSFKLFTQDVELIKQQSGI